MQSNVSSRFFGSTVRKSRFARRPRRVVENCICLKGRMGADGTQKCFCEKDKNIKCEYCQATEDLKCYCKTASSECICEDHCSLTCVCFCHEDLKISKDAEFYTFENIKTILIKDIGSFIDNDSLYEKTITCSCNSLCDGCKCDCHNEKHQQESCACNPMICEDNCACDCHPKVSSCDCNKPICKDNCACDCHPKVTSSLCTCNIECPIGCKCSINCNADIYCLNACLASCSCKCHKNQQEKPVCACSSVCDDKCKCGCHHSIVECQKECSCGCHLQCANEK